MMQVAIIVLFALMCVLLILLAAHAGMLDARLERERDLREQAERWARVLEAEKHQIRSLCAARAGEGTVAAVRQAIIQARAVGDGKKAWS